MALVNSILKTCRLELEKIQRVDVLLQREQMFSRRNHCDLADTSTTLFVPAPYLSNVSSPMSSLFHSSRWLFHTTFTVAGEQGSIAKGHSRDWNGSTYKCTGYYNITRGPIFFLSKGHGRILSHSDQEPLTYARNTSEPGSLQCSLGWIFFYILPVTLAYSSTTELWDGGASVTLRPGANHQSHCYSIQCWPAGTNYLVFPLTHGNKAPPLTSMLQALMRDQCHAATSVKQLRLILDLLEFTWQHTHFLLSSWASVLPIQSSLSSANLASYFTGKIWARKRELLQALNLHNLPSYLQLSLFPAGPLCEH